MNISVADLSEVLLTLIGFKNGYGESNSADVLGNECQINLDNFVITFAGTGLVITGMLYSAGNVLGVVVENDILFCIAYTAVIAAQESGSIEVEIKTAVILVGIPAKTYEDLCQTGVGFCQIDLLSFG